MNPDATNMSPLTDVNGVRLLKRFPLRQIYEMADGGDLIHGKYLWVWNVAVNRQGPQRELRFWTGEVFAPKRQQALTLEQVIDFILPRSRREFPAGEVQALLLVAHNTLLELRAELQGSLRGGGNFYPRSGLVQFFTTRWLGAVNNFHPAQAEGRENRSQSPATKPVETRQARGGTVAVAG